MAVRRWLGLVFGGSIGAAVAVQSRINGELGHRLGDGIAAATISFGSGLLILAVVFALSGQLRAGVGRVRVALGSGELRWWQLLGGLSGAYFVACQGLTVATIGVTAFTVATVAGQLVSSLVVDRLGWGPSGRTPVTAWRIGAAVLGLVAVVLAVTGRNGLGVRTGGHGGVSVLLVALPLVAGLLVAWQQAVNGRVGVVGRPFSATLANFATGTAALVAIEAGVLLRRGGFGQLPGEPWLYLGGLIGIVFVALAVLAVRWIGVLLLGLSSVAGQLLASLVLDVVAPSGAGLSVSAVVGCALTFVAVAVAARSRG
ncbi:DMT family transporter [Nocardia seriolae]|uniref:DMT family transporter n=1 Tax=Nocardia seriolae TaxID=37332 RepID=UPI00051A4477|nr:DMT family transporter [Nocardia seriolae]MTJ60103.1 EamA-like transporter family protein [Nocardia seriolae]MTJ74373.1 EamA-like transporter family protein [Nocardia seriolae]MTJ85103.1 EamA-like transporter family protein [Nocardia seriolae]MTK38032.1 EamA-like transporter family protein [Nocardia seriolae]MTK45665.1 EamA-like transporter family protein [Nocardia seriolae]